MDSGRPGAKVDVLGDGPRSIGSIVHSPWSDFVNTFVNICVLQLHVLFICYFLTCDFSTYKFTNL